MVQTNREAALDELLGLCTVKLTVANHTGWGTGFFVAAGKILTCAHVVKDAGSQPVKVMWQQETFEAQVVALFPDPIDLALLEFTSSNSKYPCVYFDTAVQSESKLYIYGYPDDAPDGAPVTVDCEGFYGGELPVIKFKEGQIRPGLSGSPVLNRDSRKVCGIVKFTRDRSGALGGGAIPTATIFTKLGELKEQQRKFHKQDIRWRNLLPLVRCSLRTALTSGLGIGLLIFVVRFLGVLQPLELWAYDSLMYVRPVEEVDDRILIIDITPKDYEERQKRETETENSVTAQGTSISDKSLVELIDGLQKFEPSVIGLDIYRRGLPPPLVQKNLNNLVAICKAPDNQRNPKQPDRVTSLGEAPPTRIPTNQVGFSDFLRDSDNVVRRQLLVMDLQESSTCSVSDSFNLIIAKRYLASYANSTFTYQVPKEPDYILKFGNISFPSLYYFQAGGYQSLDTNFDGYQILLNYRFVNLNNVTSIRNIAKTLTLSEALDKLSDLEDDVRDKIVLIGASTMIARDDDWNSPYEKVSGVVLHAQMISQLISRVAGSTTNNRQPRLQIQPWLTWMDFLWICGWSLVGSVGAWWLQSYKHLGIMLSIIFVVIPGFGLVFLLTGSWVPVVPPILAAGVGSGWIVYQNLRLQGSVKLLKR